LIFAELPKFDKTEAELKSDLDRWFYFLKSASSLEAVPKSMADDEAIQHAFHIANKAGFSREELDDQEYREIFIQDQRGALSLAKKQGLKEGLEKGIEQGVEQASLMIARSLLSLMDDKTIADNTGLSVRKIKHLREGEK
ncbi:MAG: Rpn family recombination-promoting nuclease/putative transposase, partial [Mariprofundaceae bacterium]|nr:Rpn family recombination-promoting nuclease/putative transposase [Mariprofundaceae bacterium]